MFSNDYYANFALHSLGLTLSQRRLSSNYEHFFVLEAAFFASYSCKCNCWLNLLQIFHGSLQQIWKNKLFFRLSLDFRLHKSMLSRRVNWKKSITAFQKRFIFQCVYVICVHGTENLCADVYYVVRIRDTLSK